MSRFALAIAATLLALPALAGSPQSKPKKTRVVRHGKVTAPVTIMTKLGDGKATVTFRFDASVEEPAITIWGADGLAVTSTPPLTEKTYKKGEKVTLEVAFTPGPGRSHLVVSAGGLFKGQQRNSVQSFAVGKPTPEQLKAGQQDVMTTSDGQRIRLMPVEKN